MDALEKIKAVRKLGSRATAKSYIDATITGFHEMHGDRRFADDSAIIGGIGWLGDMPVTAIGIEKGADLTECMSRNFGCAQPEGYRKALRLMKQAEKFNRPIICFVDTQGAGCGMGAEERGAGQAIAENLAEMMCLKTPILTVIIGEGGSGGALALAVANEVWMLSNAYYSVIAPESCASILFKDSSRVAEAADALKLFADDLYKFEVIEKIVPEPDFSNEASKNKFMADLKNDMIQKVASLKKMKTNKLLDSRYEKYRKIGRYSEIKVK